MFFLVQFVPEIASTCASWISVKKKLFWWLDILD